MLAFSTPAVRVIHTQRCCRSAFEGQQGHKGRIGIKVKPGCQRASRDSIILGMSSLQEAGEGKNGEENLMSGIPKTGAFSTF